ncbi:MAG: CPBP family intramembrane metalloprotease [Candidatus Lokiarchaeota archaeon]|nr:CPBP family intramembrane metalloprotease [Candidatus Lokiarchaeota archaeon]
MKSKETLKPNIYRVILFSLLMFIIVLLPVSASFIFTGESYNLIVTLLFFGSFILMYILPLYFVRWEGGNSIEELGVGMDDNTVRDLFIGGLTGIIASGFVVIFAYLGGTLRPVSQITTDLIISQIIITTPVAFFEELCYRGYMMTRMARLGGPIFGILLSSILFSLFHFSWWIPLGTVPPHMILLFTTNLLLGGIVLGLSYYLSGEKLWAAIGFHFMWNMIAYIMFPIYPREFAYLPEIFQIEWGIISILGFLLGAVIIWFVYSSLIQKESE